jgi:hypothetical protein
MRDFTKLKGFILADFGASLQKIKKNRKKRYKRL